MKKTVLLIGIFLGLSSLAFASGVVDLSRLNKYEGVTFSSWFCGPTEEFDNPNLCYTRGASQVTTTITMKAVPKGLFSCQLKEEIQTSPRTDLVGRWEFAQFEFLYASRSLGILFAEKYPEMDNVTIYVDENSYIRAIQKPGKYFIVDSSGN